MVFCFVCLRARTEYKFPDTNHDTFWLVSTVQVNVWLARAHMKTLSDVGLSNPQIRLEEKNSLYLAFNNHKHILHELSMNMK